MLGLPRTEDVAAYRVQIRAESELCATALAERLADGPEAVKDECRLLAFVAQIAALADHRISPRVLALADLCDALGYYARH